MTANSQSESTAVAVAGPQYDLSPRNFDEAWRLAEIMADSGMVPPDYSGKPGKCLIAVQWGQEIGLKPMQAVQNIAVINNRPSLWGDSMLALVRASPLCKYVIESDDGAIATCRTWRHGEPQEQVRTFSVTEAQQAGLADKGPWKQYAKRMRQMRARAFLLRDVYTDVLKGLHMAEEAMDMPPPGEKFMGAADVVGAPPAPPPPPTEWPADLFAQRLPEWRKAIADKKATADAIVAKAKTKHPLTAEQEQKIRAPIAADVTDAAPKVTYAQVAERLNKAGDLDQLAEAATLIAAVADEQQRVELSTLHDNRRAELA